MSSQLWRTLQIKGHDQNYMITKFDNDTIIRFAARHDSFGLNFTRKNRKSEKNPAFQKSALGILPLKIAKWNRNLPQVQPFYAVKCNPDPNVLKVLY